MPLPFEKRKTAVRRSRSPVTLWLMLMLPVLSWTAPPSNAQQKNQAEARHIAGNHKPDSERLRDGHGPDLPPAPASVLLVDGQLTIKAQNSDLTQILHRVSALSGMQVSGTVTDAHVFGVYGPGDPQSVLTRLLAGSGYNFMLIGQTAAGTPRELLLMARTKEPASSPPALPAADTHSREDQQQQDDAAPPIPLGPGAIAHVPPSEQPSNQIDPQMRLQQHLQQLQQQFQRLNQQQQPE